MFGVLQSDRMVVRRVLGGNLSAFRVLVDRYGGVVHGVAYARLRNTADAEDVAQETFIRFYQQLDQLAHRRHVGSWLVSVARNVSVDVLRKRLREAEGSKGLVVAQTAVPDPVREELHRLLWDQIEKLEPDAQEIIVLHYFMKKKAREIASLLEINTSAAEKRLQRAREELGCRLTDVLGGELGELKADARRAGRIMAAVCAAPVIWKASAGAATAAGTAAGVATGAGAAKVSAGLAAVVLLAVLGYFLFDGYFQPYSTQDITGKSTMAVVDSAPVAAAQPKANVTPAELVDGGTPEVAASQPVYPEIYGVMTGTVRYEDGTPAGGAEVWIDNESAVRWYEHMTGKGLWLRAKPVEPMRQSTTADVAGRYEIDNIRLSEGRATLTVYASKGGLFTQSGVDLIHLEREIRRDLMLHPDLVVGGVVRGSNGKSVSGAEVRMDDLRLVKGRNETIPCEFSGPDGKFLFGHVPPGLCRLSVSADGYRPYLSPWVTVGGTDVVLQLDAGLSVSGRVINMETGQPVPDVKVTGFERLGDSDRYAYRYFEGLADSGGAFRITGCEPGTYRLSVEPKQLQTSPLTLVEPLTLAVGTQPVSGLELKMSTGGELRGKVIDDETGLPASEGSAVWAGLEDGPARYCDTGSGGAYELLGLPSGELTVRACDSPTGAVKRYKGTVTLKAGEVNDHYDIHLPAFAFGGLVVDESGSPVAGASVYAVGYRQGWEVATALADDAGRFRFCIDVQEVPGSVYVQALAGDGYSAKAGPFNTREQNRNIVLRVIRSGRLEGDVVDQEGRPLERSVISAVPDSVDAVIPRHNLPINDGRSINKPLGGSNVFVYPMLHPGMYTLEVRTSAAVERPIATTEVTIEAGRTTTAHLVVDMTGFGEIEGTVLAGGEPVAGQQVYVKHETYPGTAGGITGPDGFYVVRGILPGTVRVMVEPQEGFSGQRMTQSAEVVGGEVVTVDFNLSRSDEATGSVEGYVISNGAPMQYANVAVRPANAESAESYVATVDSQGWYRIDQIPEGEYVAEADLGRVIRAVPVQVVANRATRVDFNLAVGAIQGLVSGIRQGEKAFVMVFPGDAFLSEWTLAAMEALGEQVVAMRDVAEDGPFSFTQLNPGEYIVGAVAVPADAPFEAASMMNARIAVSPVVVATPDSPAEVELEIK